VSPQELRSRVEPPLALLLGREGDGLSEEVEARLDERVEIPIDPRIESLNVAAAAAILLATLSGGAARG
jgi:tRNA G18 (ribose-2'-O)-methylase SpoU